MKKTTSRTHGNALHIGVDVEVVQRFEGLDRISDRAFLNKIYTPRELNFCFSRKNTAEALASRFSAKESVLKALHGFNVRIAKLTEIEIKSGTGKSPEVHLRTPALSRYDVKISISHSKLVVVTAALAKKI